MTPTDVIGRKESLYVLAKSLVRSAPNESVSPRGRPMNSCSILFRGATDRVPDDRCEPPDFFRDLNLDQIVAAIAAGKEEYNLKPFFYAALRDVDCIRFRHEVMQDLEDTRLLAVLQDFALGMRAVRDSLARLEKHPYVHQKEYWFLEALTRYGEVVARLSSDLSAAGCRSRGFRAFSAHLMQYVSSATFVSLVDEAKRLKAELSAIRYSVVIRGSRVEIHRYGENPDYGGEVAATFARFQQGAAQEHRFKFSNATEMNHIEAQILDGVVQLHRETFAKLGDFYATRREFLDAAIVAFDREVEFYIAYLDYIGPLKKAGLAFCCPRVDRSDKEVHGEQVFDLALAAKLVEKGAAPVCNDFHLKGRERIIVVSGPNQGGKTTFARTFGQLHYLGGLGLPVPGVKAQLHLFDRIFTHFEREEQMPNLRGKLEDDVVRIHAILQAATPHSVIIVNEIFASTTLRDALFLGRTIAAAMIRLDVLCVWVTFLDELSALGEQTVSMVSTVVPGNPAQRTFKIVRQAADGLAYAMSLAEKHRLTYAVILERLRS